MGALIFTEDGGKSWHETLVGEDVHRVAIDPTNPDRVFAAIGGGVLISPDAGRTWHPVQDLVGKYIHVIRFDSSDPARIYVGAADAPPIYVSEDGGSKWRPLGEELPSTGIGVDSVELHPTDPDVLFYGGAVGEWLGRLFVSEDRGKNWRILVEELPKIRRLRASPWRGVRKEVSGVRIGLKCGQWGWSFTDLEESWKVADDAGFDLLSCFDRITSAPRGFQAWDAVALLVAMSAATKRARLAAHMLNSTLRHPVVLAGQLAVAQALSRGRLEVGLGAGAAYWKGFDNQPTSIPFPSHSARIARLGALCRTLPALWRGETVTDEILALRGVSLGPLGIVPPLLVLGGRSKEILVLSARYADGWDAVDCTPDEFERLSRRLDELCRTAGRTRAIDKSVQIWVSELGDSDPRSVVRRYEEVGCSTAIFVLHHERGANVVRQLADKVL